MILVLSFFFLYLVLKCILYFIGVYLVVFIFISSYDFWIEEFWGIIIIMIWDIVSSILDIFWESFIIIDDLWFWMMDDFWFWIDSFFIFLVSIEFDLIGIDWDWIIIFIFMELMLIIGIEDWILFDFEMWMDEDKKVYVMGKFVLGQGGILIVSLILRWCGKKGRVDWFFLIDVVVMKLVMMVSMGLKEILVIDFGNGKEKVMVVGGVV